MIKIISDSSCDIREVKIMSKDLEVEFAPLKIIVGDKEFVDDDTIDVKAMFKAMKEYEGKTSSACPSPDEYEKLFEGADEIYVITISGNLSGSYNAACLARDMHLEKYPHKKIFILDSLSTSGTMALVMYKINELVKQNKKFEEICVEIENYARNKTGLVFVLHSLDNLVKNGRVSKIVGATVNVLGIKLVGRASNEGTLEPYSKVRSHSKVIDCFLKEMERLGYCGGKVVLSHVDNEKDVINIKNSILKSYPNAEIIIVEAKGLVSYYAESKGILMGFEY